MVQYIIFKQEEEERKRKKGGERYETETDRQTDRQTDIKFNTDYTIKCKNIK